jgi:hypothetical protein
MAFVYQADLNKGALMTRPTTLGVTLLATFILSLMVTSASALTLPDIHALTYPLHLSFADNGNTPGKFIDTAGNKWESKGFLLLLEIGELTSLGTYGMLFLNLQNPTTKETCKTAGDAAGEVLIHGTFHIVPLNTSKEDGILFLFKEFKITCGTEIVKVRGAVISTVNFEGKSESEEFTQLCGKLTGDGKGHNNITEYLNDGGTKTKGLLEDERGLGFNPLAVEIGEEFCMKALNSGMFLILNR